MCTVLLPPGVNQIALNNVSYRNISYHITSNGSPYTVSLLSPRNCNSVIYYFGMSIICIADKTNRNELCVISSHHASVLDTAQELRSYNATAKQLRSLTATAQELISYTVKAQDLRPCLLKAQQQRSYTAIEEELRP